ncbi:hypothetical protein VTN96DRAFT_8352 [Rasamsonia emersonii]
MLIQGAQAADAHCRFGQDAFPSLLSCLFLFLVHGHRDSFQSSWKGCSIGCVIGYEHSPGRRLRCSGPPSTKCRESMMMSMIRLDFLICLTRLTMAM